MKLYVAHGNIADADCIIGHSFGTSVDVGSPNHQLACLMLELADGRPMIADRTLVNAMPGGDSQMAYIVEGKVTNIKAEGIGTWGTLLAAKEYMEANKLHVPAQIAQACTYAESTSRLQKLA